MGTALMLGLGLVSGVPTPAAAHIGEYAGAAGSFLVGGGSSQSMSVVRVVRETDGLYWVKFQKQAPESVDRTAVDWGETWLQNAGL